MEEEAIGVSAKSKGESIGEGEIFGEGEIVRSRRSKVRFFETPVLRSYQGMDLGFFYANAFALKLVCWYALVCCFYTLLSVECAFSVMRLGVYLFIPFCGPPFV